MEIPSSLHSWTIYPVWFCEWKLRALIHWNAISTFEGIFVNYNWIVVNYTTIFEWLFSLFSQCFQNYLPTYLLQCWAQWQLKGNSFFCLCVCFVFWHMVSLCKNSNSPGTHLVYQNGLKLPEICLLCPMEILYKYSPLERSVFERK